MASCSEMSHWRLGVMFVNIESVYMVIFRRARLFSTATIWFICLCALELDGFFRQQPIAPLCCVKAKSLCLVSLALIEFESFSLMKASPICIPSHRDSRVWKWFFPARHGNVCWMCAVLFDRLSLFLLSVDIIFVIPSFDCCPWYVYVLKVEIGKSTEHEVHCYLGLWVCYWSSF